MRFPIVFLATMALLSACTSATSSAPAPPWQGEALTSVPEVYRSAWNGAENRSTCALVAFANTPADATPRRANFSGGWAVAYDTPSQRSAFGIAGTGTSADAGSTYQWPDEIVWSDGSHVSYGLEGGTGPNHLAYLRIEGQDCLYNVWSARGEEHLVGLLQQIRFVR
ncbi:MAG TPA: hypothetical protein VFT12_04580 [Thermoanaerobaculia bacterium]|nr:hypothetical protein [Thermoanaerobaculia bacterium]